MRIGSMLDGTARKPFVSRSLVPSVFKAAAKVGEEPAAALRTVLRRYETTNEIIRGFDRSHRIGSESRALGHTSWRAWPLAILAVALWPLLECDDLVLQ